MDRNSGKKNARSFELFFSVEEGRFLLLRHYFICGVRLFEGANLGGEGLCRIFHFFFSAGIFELFNHDYIAMDVVTVSFPMVV